VYVRGTLVPSALSIRQIRSRVPGLWCLWSQLRPCLPASYMQAGVQNRVQERIETHNTPPSEGTFTAGAAPVTIKGVWMARCVKRVVLASNVAGRRAERRRLRGMGGGGGGGGMEKLCAKQKGDSSRTTTTGLTREAIAGRFGLERKRSAERPKNWLRRRVTVV